MFENPRRGTQARNFTTNVSKLLDLLSSSDIFQKLTLGASDYWISQKIMWCTQLFQKKFRLCYYCPGKIDNDTQDDRNHLKTTALENFTQGKWFLRLKQVVAK